MLKTAGIVLCGGQSSRMGRPKAWLPFGDEVMLTRVVRRLAEVVAPIVVVAAPGQEVPALPAEVEVVRDPERGPTVDRMMLRMDPAESHNATSKLREQSRKRRDILKALHHFSDPVEIASDADVIDARNFTHIFDLVSDLR